MSRINIDDKLWSDARFDALKNILGNELLAIGMVVKSFRIAQEYWKTDTQLIPCEIWDLYNFSAMEKVGLVERYEDGVYVKGSYEQFDWLKRKQIAGKIGGQKSAKIRQQKYGTAQPQESEYYEALSKHNSKHSLDNAEAAPKPPTPTPTLNTYTSNKPCDHKGHAHDENSLNDQKIISIWNEMLTGVLSRVIRVTDKRKRAINAQIKKYPDIEHWKQCFEKVKASDFLSGKSSEWRCGFDWILNENNRIKVMEGNYDNKSQQVPYKVDSRVEKSL